MSTESDQPEDGELEAWLEGLGGRGGDDDAVTKKLRETVLRRQQAFEDEVDELRLRRGREQLLAEARRTQTVHTSSRRGGPLAIAASIVMMATVGIFSYQALFVDPATGEAELLMYYGELERPRGGIQSVSVDVAAPLENARAVAGRLIELEIPFELTRDESGRIVLSMIIADAEEAAAVGAALGGAEGDVIAPGYYVVEFE